MSRQVTMNSSVDEARQAQIIEEEALQAKIEEEKQQRIKAALIILSRMDISSSSRHFRMISDTIFDYATKR